MCLQAKMTLPYKNKFGNNNELFWGNNLKVIILMGSKTEAHNEPMLYPVFGVWP